MQVQIRSGDEPMTTFYRVRPSSTSQRRPDAPQCVACKNQWREG